LSRAEAAVAASGPQTGSGAPTPSTSPKPLDQAKTPNNKVEPVSAEPTTGSGNPTPANADAGKPAQPDFAKQARDQEALNKKVQADADAKALGDFGGSQDPTAMRDIKVPAQAQSPASFKFTPDQEKWLGGADRQDPNILARMPGAKPPVSYFKDPADQAIAKKLNFGQKNLNTIKKTVGMKQGDAETFATQQNQSKDYNMKKAMNESASMNVSMTADTADQVAELMKLLKNAGMSDAAPVSSMMAPTPPMGAAAPKQDNMADFINMVGGDEMEGPGNPCSVCGDVHEETSCSEDTSEYDAVVAEWDNSPDEEYKDANYMLNDLAGGLNRPKKAYAAAQDGDNAMAVEAIKADLRKALEEALAKK
jgi:hypothetical protein